MNPEYGCNLSDFLFEAINTTKLNFLREHIRTAIINYETRIELNDITIDSSNYQNGELRIALDYTIEQSNTRFNLVFPFYKIEGTDIPLLYNSQVIQIAE
jgi:phage baseplate assembly protein W